MFQLVHSEIGMSCRHSDKARLAGVVWVRWCVLAVVFAWFMAGVAPVAADGPRNEGSGHNMTTWTVYSVAELETAFASIADGGRIELAPGSYGHTKLSDRHFVTGVTITSAVADDQAVFTNRLLLDGVSGVTVEALQVEAAQLASGRNFPRLHVVNSADVTVSDVKITGHIASANEGADPVSRTVHRLDPIAGFGQDTGLNVRGSTGVTVTGVEMSDLRLGMSVSNSHDIVIRDAEIHGVREGINTNDVRGLLVEDSVFRNFTPWMGGPKANIDHADMIQFWSVNSKFGVHDLTIRNNVFRQDAGDLHTQTIFGHGRDAAPGVTMTNFTIVGNTIINGQMHGISIADVTGVTIRDNVLLPKSDLPDRPSQVDRPTIWTLRSADIEISGNTLVPLSNQRDMKIDRSTNVTIADDNIILSYDPGNPLFWRTVLDQVEAGTWAHGGADHAALDIVPNVPDDRSTDADTILQAARDAGWVEKTADPAGSLLDPGRGTAVLIGGDGNDWLRGRGQDTVMVGGGGADTFSFDFRDPGSAARHVVLDLDWTEGDFLRLLTPEGGQFVRSQAQLDALVANGTLVAVARADGMAPLLHVADRPGQQIELIASMAAADMLDWIG